MIVYENKGYETRSDKPDEDWTGKARFVVPDGSELAGKIVQLYPYYEFVIQGDVLIDVTETERPPEPEPEPTIEERLALVEEIMADQIGMGM